MFIFGEMGCIGGVDEWNRLIPRTVTIVTSFHH